jgi:hypothetical protein
MGKLDLSKSKKNFYFLFKQTKHLKKVKKKMYRLEGNICKSHTQQRPSS